MDSEGRGRGRMRRKTLTDYYFMDMGGWDGNGIEYYNGYFWFRMCCVMEERGERREKRRDFLEN